MSVGVITPRKKSVTTEVAFSVGKFCTYTLLMTVCSTTNIREKRESMKLTQAVACTNSLNSSRGILGLCSTPRNAGNQERHRKPGQAEGNRRKETNSQSTSVRPVIFPSLDADGSTHCLQSCPKLEMTSFGPHLDDGSSLCS